MSSPTETCIKEFVPVHESTGDVAIFRQSDATPFVRIVAHSLALAASTESGAATLARFSGVVAVRSSSDPQKVTVRRRADQIMVEHGIAADADMVIDIDPTTRTRAIAVEPSSAAALADEFVALLDPAVAPWRELTTKFWQQTNGLRGMPSLRIVEIGSADEVVLGDSRSPYEIHGSAAKLSRLLAGLDYFADSVFDGSLLIRGTFSQFSIVSGASMKVMWDVQ